MKNLKSIKFEKINMKLVIAIGIVVILILTAMFIIFRTNLIVDRSNKNNNTNTNSASNSNSNEKPDDSNSNTNSNTNTNNNDDDDDDKDTETVSEEAKNRTKSADKLNEAERLYILEENIQNTFKDDKETQSECDKNNKDVKSGDLICFVQAIDFVDYADNAKTGWIIKGCEGEISFVYDSSKKEYIVDTSKVTCK